MAEVEAAPVVEPPVASDESAGVDAPAPGAAAPGEPAAETAPAEVSPYLPSTTEYDSQWCSDRPDGSDSREIAKSLQQERLKNVKARVKQFTLRELLWKSSRRVRYYACGLLHVWMLDNNASCCPKLDIQNGGSSGWSNSPSSRRISPFLFGRRSWCRRKNFRLPRNRRRGRLSRDPPRCVAEHV